MFLKTLFSHAVITIFVLVILSMYNAGNDALNIGVLLLASLLYFFSGYILTTGAFPWYRYFGIAAIGIFFWLLCFILSPDSMNYKRYHAAGPWFFYQLYIAVRSPANFIDGFHKQENYSLSRDMIQCLIIPVLLSLLQFAGGMMKIKVLRSVKHSFMLLMLCSASTAMSSQHTPNADSVYSIIRQHSIYRNIADWPAIDAGFHTRLDASKTDVDSIRALVYVLEQLGDVHSYISYNHTQYGNYPIFDEEKLKYLMPLVTRSQAQTGIIKTQLIDHEYAYLQLPGIMAWGEQSNLYAQAIADSICHFPGHVKGFVIDLRLNGGGQLSAMLTGLNQLLGNNYLGGGVDSEGIETHTFEIHDHNFCIGTVPMNTINNRCSRQLDKIPVVLIIGPATRSSGSIVAIAFKGRANTLFVGEPTADGYSTGNDYFYFSPTLDMNLSTSFSQDRDHNIYKNSVTPDLPIDGGDNFEDIHLDEKVKAAIDWIKKNSK